MAKLNLERNLIDSSVYELLPEPLKQLTLHFDRRERDVVLLSAIGALSCCYPNVYGIYRGRRLYANLYLAIIAPAASGKGVMNYSRLLVEPIHDKILSDSRQLKVEYAKSKNENKGRKTSSDDSCPETIIKLLPGNISSSEMYAYVGRADNGVLIFESEADTLGVMLKNDWGNYSDVLRKAYHHEPLAISRKIEGLYMDIKEPQMSLVMSGTPEQLTPVIGSKENGLFSRFMFYYFDEVLDFDDVFEHLDSRVEDSFKHVGRDIFKMYGGLRGLNHQIKFSLALQQRTRMIKLFRELQAEIIENYSSNFIAVLKRHGVMLFRMALGFTLLRNIDNVSEKSELICCDDDYDLVESIIINVLSHALYTYNSFDSYGFTIQDEAILDELGEFFTRAKAVDVAEKHNMPKRTIDDKLRRWKMKRIIKSVKKGEYKKL